MRALIEALKRALEERLSRVEAAQESRGARIRRSTSEDQASYLDDDAASGERVGSASGRRGGVNPDSLPQAVGEVGIVGGSTFALSPREISSIKTAVPKLGSSADFPLWKRRFEGFALSNDCMQNRSQELEICR